MLQPSHEALACLFNYRDTAEHSLDLCNLDYATRSLRTEFLGRGQIWKSIRANHGGPFGMQYGVWSSHHNDSAWLSSDLHCLFYNKLLLGQCPRETLGRLVPMLATL